MAAVCREAPEQERIYRFNRAGVAPPDALAENGYITGALQLIGMMEVAAMEPRIDLRKVNADALKPLAQFGQYLQQSGLDARTIHLIEIRASQINGCGY